MQQVVRYFFLVSVLVIGISVSASAAVHMVNQEQAAKKSESSEAWVSDTALRVDATEKGRSLSYIYHRDDQQLMIVDHKAKTYRLVDAQILQKEQAKGYDIAPIQFSRFGEYINIDAKMCRFYNGIKLNKKQTDVWTVDPRQVGLSSDAYKTMQDARLYMQTYASDVAAFFHAGSRQWEGAQGYSGIPVKSVIYSKNGKEARSIQLQKIENIDVKDDFFAVPQGYKKAI